MVSRLAPVLLAVGILLIPSCASVQELAEQGDAVAQYNLGVMYRNGEGVTEDDVEASASTYAFLSVSRVVSFPFACNHTQRERS